MNEAVEQQKDKRRGSVQKIENFQSNLLSNQKFNENKLAKANQEMEKMKEQMEKTKLES